MRALAKTTRENIIWSTRTVREANEKEHLEQEEEEEVREERERESGDLSVDCKMQLGHSYLKQGFSDDAINYFSQIYRDKDAPLPSRLEALREVCQFHEGQGVIESLRKIHEEVK